MAYDYYCQKGQWNVCRADLRNTLLAWLKYSSLCWKFVNFRLNRLGTFQITLQSSKGMPKMFFMKMKMKTVFLNSKFSFRYYLSKGINSSTSFIICYFKFLAKRPSGGNISHIIIHALMLKHLKGAHLKIQNMLDLKLRFHQPPT